MKHPGSGISLIEMHLQIHEQHVRLMFTQQTQDMLPSLADANNAQVRVITKQGDNSGAGNHVVINHDNTNRQ